MSTSKKLKQSEPVVIKRSQINFAPYNPKKHTRDAILKQLKNFKDIGFLGGVVWNIITGNLVSGHKRVMSMDVYYKYDGTPETDYDIRVEKIELTDKQEKEQNIFMDARATNTAQDLDMVALLIPDIDFKLAGLDDTDMRLMDIQIPDLTGGNEEIKSDFALAGKDYQQRKETLKQAKKDLKKGLAYSQSASYITLSFDNYQNKSQFLDTYGFRPDAIMIKGEEFFDKLNG